MPRTPSILVAAVALALGAAPVRAESGNFLLIRRDQPAQRVEIAEIGARRVVYRADESGWLTVSRDRCVALLREDAVIVVRRHGWLRLADGQIFPGEALSNTRPAEDLLAWNQLTWLGRLEVPLDRIESVAFSAGATVPRPGEGDVLTLANGDRLEGFVTTLGDPVVVELLEAEPGEDPTVELPLDRVTAVRMVTPPQRPQGRRLWLIDGTVFDVDEVLLGDDGMFRLEGVPFGQDSSQRVELAGVAAVLFNAEALQPFAAMSPRRVQGPPTRYRVPEPTALHDRTALGLSPVEFRGPVSATYVLPEGALWFSAEAMLPVLAREWGDCMLVVLDDDRPVFSTRLSAAEPSASIGVSLKGSVLTIEVTEGSAGPIQDRVVLDRAMILVDR